MTKTFTAYISLHRADGTEPVSASGYTRACMGEVDVWDVPELPRKHNIVFNEVMDPGFGCITEYRLYNRPEGGEALFIWTLPEPVNTHAGTIPVIRDGRLLLGMDVSAQILMNSASQCRTSGCV